MRIMTYNIRGGLGMDGRRDTARIAAVVMEQHPDIVCFQEVHQRLPWSGGIDQPRHLRRALGMEFVFQTNVRFGFGNYGVGVATRFPVRRVQRHHLPSVGETRGALEVVLEAPGHSLTVFCTHWGLKSEERQRQAQALSAIVHAASAPVILCGDFNELAYADGVRLLLRDTGLNDWGGEDNRATYPADAPASRIDFLFGTPGLTVRRASVIDTDASDHRPVVADFEWDAQSGGV